MTTLELEIENKILRVALKDVLESEVVINAPFASYSEALDRARHVLLFTTAPTTLADAYKRLKEAASNVRLNWMVSGDSGLTEMNQALAEITKLEGGE